MSQGYGAFLVICFLLTITPGADTALVLKSSLGGHQGRHRKVFVMTTLGICAGLLVHATLSALGLSAILQESARLYSVIQMIGAGYLVYLGIRALYDVYGNGAAGAAVELLGAEVAGRSGFAEFRTGLLTNVLNPKVAVFYLTFLPQFVDVAGNVLLQSLLLAAVHIAMSFVWLCLIGFFTGYFRDLLMRPVVRRRIETVTGLALIGFGARLALSRD